MATVAVLARQRIVLSRANEIANGVTKRRRSEAKGLVAVRRIERG